MSESKCNCWCKGDTYKAPEQHHPDCPESLQSRGLTPHRNTTGTKYEAPHGLRQAIFNAARYIDTGNTCLEASQVNAIGEAVCRWIAENPIEPTDEQCNQMIELIGANGRASVRYPSRIDSAQSRLMLIEWQRRMFLAPEMSKLVGEIVDRMRGHTFTPEERDCLLECINTNSQPRPGVDPISLAGWQFVDTLPSWEKLRDAKDIDECGSAINALLKEGLLAGISNRAVFRTAAIAGLFPRMFEKPKQSTMEGE
jgi:hypothetical protein